MSETPPPSSSQSPIDEREERVDDKSSKKKAMEEVVEVINDLSGMGKKEIAISIIILLGLILSIFLAIPGGLIVGFISGLFITRYFKARLRDLYTAFREGKTFQAIVLSSLYICVFFAIPALMIGIMAGLGIKSLIQKE